MIARGQIYFASLNPAKGREQKGTRPLLVVSSDVINRLPLVITVVPGTDARNIDKDYPTNVRVPARESGLSMDTVFLCFQLRSIDPSRLLDPVNGRSVPRGALPASWMAEIDAALRLVLSI